MNRERAAPIDLADLLAFYREAGVDEPVLDEAVDRMAPAPPAEARRVPEPQQSPEAGAPATADPILAPDGAQADRAREIARSATSLDALCDLLAAFDGCNLRNTAKNLVFGDGNPAAPIMFVGEAPGREEDLEGRPFVGPSGRLLDAMLKAIGLDRGSAYIANVIPWRPPGNRTPTPLETEICRPFIERQIELVNPKILVTLGNPSTKQLLGATEGILRVRGSWRDYHTAGGVTIKAMPLLHPAYLLRNPIHKRLAWRDLLAIRKRLDEAGEMLLR